jgi:ribosomal protein S18 acetylase RimI-like enzyme
MLNRRIPYDKQMRRYPAVLIGRLGVNNKFHGHVIGTELMEYLKARFTDEQYETACRYLAVDAYNNPQTLNFYENKCNFTFLFKSEELESEKSGYPLPLHTRFMFYDLIHVKEQK